MNKPLNFDTSILLGNNLKVLLNSDHITYGEINNTLKTKGIYVGISNITPKKSILVPLLSSTILTPEEFTNLIEVSIVRENKPKIKSSRLQLAKEDIDWITPLKRVKFSHDIDGDLENISFEKRPKLTIQGNTIKISYQILKKDYSKDWLQREVKFTGEILISKETDYLKFSSNHTSKETDLINRKLIKITSSELKKQNISIDNEPNSIRFNSFINNQERILFFKRLIAGIPKSIILDVVNNIEISLDQSAPPLPTNDPTISWMKGIVEKMNVDGKQLEDLFIMTDQYSKYYHIQKMDAKFKYSNGQNKGSCRISFFFTQVGRSDESYQDGEFTFSCIKTVYPKRATAEAKTNISQFINKQIQDIIDNEFQKILSERQ